MGILSRIFTPGPDRFARIVQRAMRRAGVDEPIAYDRENFMLIIGTGGTEGKLYLGNVYQDYCQSPRSQRDKAVLNRIVASMAEPMTEIPKSFDEIRSQLLPKVRERYYGENLKLLGRLEGGEGIQPASQVLVEHFSLELVIDLPHAMAMVMEPHLQEWGVSFDQCLAVAKENLWKISNERWQTIADGVYASPWQDSYDASRIALEDLIWQLEVDGDHVVTIPTREIVLVTGSNNEQGLQLVAELTGQYMQKSRGISGRALCLKDHQWQSFVPPLDHPAGPAFHELILMSDGDIANSQKELLDKIHVKEQQDIFVASYMAVRDESSGAALSFCTWSQDVLSLLPRTERVMLVKGQGNVDDMKPIGMVKFDELLDICGDRIKPQGMYPERYRVDGFPSEDQISRMELIAQS